MRKTWKPNTVVEGKKTPTDRWTCDNPYCESVVDDPELTVPPRGAQVGAPKGWITKSVYLSELLFDDMGKGAAVRFHFCKIDCINYVEEVVARCGGVARGTLDLDGRKK